MRGGGAYSGRIGSSEVTRYMLWPYRFGGGGGGSGLTGKLLTHDIKLVRCYIEAKVALPFAKGLGRHTFGHSRVAQK